MDERDGRRALPYRRRDTLDRAVADVAHGEHARDAGLEEHRGPSQRPGGRPALGEEIAPGHDEAPLVAHDPFREPARVRRGADEHEEGVGRDGLDPAGLGVAERQPVQVVGPLAVHDLGVGADGDDVRGGDGRDEVLGHALGQPVAPDQERHRSGVLGQVERGLPRRVAAAGDEHVAIPDRGGLGDGRAVEHAGADHGLEAGDAEAPVGDAGGQHHAARRHRRTVGELQDVTAGIGSQRDGVAHEVEVGAEVPRLLVGAHRQLVAADAGREAEEVPDHRGRAGLPAEGLLLEHQGAQALGRAVHRGGQAGRSRPDHDHVEGFVELRGVHAEGVGQVGVRWVEQWRTVEDEHRQAIGSGRRPSVGAAPRPRPSRPRGTDRSGPSG